MTDDDKLSSLYQQSRTDEPPLKLDSAVLSHARKAVAKKPFRLSGWLAPATAVATVMLTASLIIMMKSEHPEVMESGTVSDKAVQDRLAAPEPEADRARPAAKVPGAGIKQAAPEPSRMAPAEQVAPQRQLMLRARPAAPALRDAEKKAGRAGLAEPMPGKAAAKDAATMMKKEQVRSPEAWMAEIRKLHEQGREMEAADEMKQFRLQYPDYPVPAGFPVK